MNRGAMGWVSDYARELAAQDAAELRHRLAWKQCEREREQRRREWMADLNPIDLVEVDGVWMTREDAAHAEPRRGRTITEVTNTVLKGPAVDMRDRGKGRG